MKKTKIGLAAALATASAFACVLGVGTAQADPTGTPTYRALSGVGSDTIQDVMNALSNSITIGGVKQLGSYNATGTSTIQTKATGCNSVARPNGSGAGRTALINSLAANSGAGDGCLDFARSSKLDLAASSPSVTYVPFAVDAVSYAVTNTSSISRSLSSADLTAIYHCDSTYVGTSSVPASNPANTYDVTPQLPQTGSGTRSYWLGKVGLTEQNITDNINGSLACLVNGTKNGQIIEEHTGTALDDKSIVPFSIGQYNAQATQLIADRRGRGVLGKVDNTIPQLTNASFAFSRDVFNIIPTSKVGTSPWSDVFVGPQSIMCSPASQAIVAQYGFAALSGSGAHVCGDTSQHS